MNRPQEQSPLQQGPSILPAASGAQAARPGRAAGCSSTNPIDHIFQFHKVLHQPQLSSACIGCAIRSHCRCEGMLRVSGAAQGC